METRMAHDIPGVAGRFRLDSPSFTTNPWCMDPPSVVIHANRSSMLDRWTLYVRALFLSVRRLVRRGDACWTMDTRRRPGANFLFEHDLLAVANPCLPSSACDPFTCIHVDCSGYALLHRGCFSGTRPAGQIRR